MRRPVRPPAARHRPRPLAPVRAGDRRRLRGHQARLGAGQLQLLHLRGGLPLHRRRGGPGRHARLGAAAASTGSTRTPGCGGTAAAWSSRRCGWPSSCYDATAACAGRPATRRAGEEALAGYLAEARAMLRRAATAADCADEAGAGRTRPASRSCAGSTCPPSACAPVRRVPLERIGGIDRSAPRMLPTSMDRPNARGPRRVLAGRDDGGRDRPAQRGRRVGPHRPRRGRRARP